MDEFLTKEQCIEWIRDHAPSIAEGLLEPGACMWFQYDDDEGFDSTMMNAEEIRDQINEIVIEAITKALQSLAKQDS